MVQHQLRLGLRLNWCGISASLQGELVKKDKSDPHRAGWVKKDKSDPHRAGWGLYKTMERRLYPPAIVFEYLADKTDLGSELVSIILET